MHNVFVILKNDNQAKLSVHMKNVPKCYKLIVIIPPYVKRTERKLFL